MAVFASKRESTETVNVQDLVYSTTWVDAIMSLRPHMFIFLRVDGLYPVFGKIISIFFLGTFCFLKVMYFETLSFDDMYQAFVVKGIHHCEYLNAEVISSQRVYVRRALDRRNNNLCVSKSFMELN